MKIINILIVVVAVMLNAVFLSNHYGLFDQNDDSLDISSLHSMMAKGENEEAMQLAESAYRHAIAAYGTDDTRTMNAAKNLAFVYRYTEKTETALAIYKDLLETYQAAPYEHQEEILAILSEIIGVHMQQEDTIAAIEVAEEKLQLRESLFGPGSLQLLGDLLIIVDLYRQTEQYDKGIAMVQRGLDIMETDFHANIRLRNHFHITMMNLQHLQEQIPVNISSQQQTE